MLAKPVMSESVEADVLAALSQYTNRNIWERWGMDTIRKQGSCVLLYGPTGTGKTTIARWMAKRAKHGFKQLSLADVGSEEPGQTERNIHEFFDDCESRNWATMFMDEADHLLGDRRKVDDTTWQLPAIETIMTRMVEYKGLVILASNHADALDPALASRFMAMIHVGEPDFDMRRRLWKQKLPNKFPLRFTEAQIRKLSKYELNGRQIETVFICVASHAIRLNKRPTLAMFELFAEREKAKKISAVDGND